MHNFQNNNTCGELDYFLLDYAIEIFKCSSCIFYTYRLLETEKQKEKSATPELLRPLATRPGKQMVKYSIFVHANKQKVNLIKKVMIIIFHD